MARSRPRKPRLSRMDAAVDAMAPFGFPAEKVRKHVKLLLQVYGGDVGWPFIEEYSYKELLDAMLRDVEEEHAVIRNEEEEEVTEDKGETTVKKTLTFEDERGVGTSTRDEGPRDKNSQASIATAPSCSNAEPKSPKINNTSPLKNHTIPSMTLPLPPANSRLPHRDHRHCYGWIESNNDEDDFVCLKPASGVLGGEEEVALPLIRSRSRRNQKSRWDLRPDDA